MKIYSWNVNGLRAVLRKGTLQDFITKEHPDILCLQEIKAKSSQVLIDLPDYQEFWNPAVRPGYSGTAIFVKQGINVKSVLINNTNSGVNSEGRILTLEFQNFFLVNVYTPNSKPDLSRLKLREKIWDPTFLKHLQQLENIKPVIACGDFNVAHTEIDLARPKQNTKNAGFTIQERQGINNLLQASFLDTFRYLHPHTQRYTWWSYLGNARINNVGWRIDYFFISNSLKNQLKSAEIHENIFGSDHCPISIEMELS